jgi:hemolysin III
MGWVAVFAVPALFQAVPTGGLVYSAGAAIYWLRRPNPMPGVFGFHEL